MSLGKGLRWLGLAVLLAKGLAWSQAADSVGWPPPPGNIVAISPEPATDFLGSPSIVTLPDGTYLAAHDIFGRNAHRLYSTWIYSSHDYGVSWEKISTINDQFWPMLFTHRGGLYLIGTNKEYGDIIIRCSTDGGRHWTVPTTEKTGLLFCGHFACAPVPFASLAGRLWRGFEEYTGPDGSWSGRYFRSFVVSVPEGDDLLDAANWKRTNGLDFNGDWLKGNQTGWLEGNVVVTPDGGLVNILRLETWPVLNEETELEGPAAGYPRSGIAAVIRVDPAGQQATYEPAHGFIRFPGGQAKFTIRYDDKSRRYWSLVSKITDPRSAFQSGPRYQPSNQRNVLVLTSSADLIHWQEHAIILRWREGLPIHARDRVGFQYVDWQIEGDDLIAVCRTAWNGAS